MNGKRIVYALLALAIASLACVGAPNFSSWLPAPIATSTVETQTGLDQQKETADLTATLAPTEEVRYVTAQQGAWTVLKFERLNDNPAVVQMIDLLKDPDPKLWPTFPNVANKLATGFDVKNGAEYGEDDSPFCEYKQTCDWVVPGWHFRYITGDYKFTSPQFSYQCTNSDPEKRKGCFIMFINVMDQSFTWRDQSVDNGFTVMGRYWNGDALEWAVWGLSSHASANMLGYPTVRDTKTGDVLNAGDPSSNAGANCGVQPNSCVGADVTVVIHAGDQILAVLQTTVK